MLRATLAVIVPITIAIPSVTAVKAAPSGRPCAEIVAACRQAGFVPGGRRTGEGLQADCVQPIIAGAAQPRRAAKPLPQVDPQVVAACRAADPRFGGTNEPPANPPPNSPAAAQPAALTPPPLPAGTQRPNIVFVLADDFSLDLVQYMPNLLKMQREGMTFANYFVTDSLCCPSRSSIFTGRYPHNTGIYRNTGADGGYLAFRSRGHEQVTFATSLTAAGYRTAMLGKYLNGYQPRQHAAAPGWSEWGVGGNAYKEFDYDLNQNGSVLHYGRQPADYLTDVVSARAVRFIKQKTSAAPFMIEIATFAPHAPYTPAPRDVDAFANLRAPHTPAFNAEPDTNAPKWLARLLPLSTADMARIDADYRKRAQSVLAIDAMIGVLQQALAETGAADNTYFVFSSDNGYHMGEHRMMPGKMTAFDTDIHVPLVITGPGVPRGVAVQEIVQNIDLCPTFTDLAVAAPLPEADGRSLVPLLRGTKVEDWRTLALVEHRGPMREIADPDLPAPRSGNPTTYEAIRTSTSLYVEYATGEREYHDLASDPHEMRNTYSSRPDEEKTRLHAALDAVRTCRGRDSCQVAERLGGTNGQ